MSKKMFFAAALMMYAVNAENDTSDFSLDLKEVPDYSDYR